MPAFDMPQLPEESLEILHRLVPPPNRPPLLYLAMAANPAVLRAYADGPILGLKGLLHTGQLSPPDRELVILRVTGKCRAEHEWGVHVAYFGKTSGLSRSQVDATVTGAHPTPAWTLRQLAIIAIADAIVERRAFTPEETELIWEELGAAERTEFIAVAALYLGIAAQCAALQIPTEPGTPQLPTSP